MVSRFLGLVGSLPLDEQKIWLPNQMVHDPDTWTTPHLLQLKREYVTLVDKYGYVVNHDTSVFRKLSRCKTLPLPPPILSYCLLSNALIRPMNAFRSVLSRGILFRSCEHVLLMTLLGIICRLVKQSQQILRFTIGLFINWGHFLVPWDTGLKFITLRL